MIIKFFASLRERLECEEENWQDTEKITTVADVVTRLQQKGDAWAEVFSEGKILIAVNQEMASLKTPVKPSDEIAFFPPVTGG